MGGGSESGNQMLLDHIFMKEIVCDSPNTPRPPPTHKLPGFFVYGNAGTLLPGGHLLPQPPTFPHTPGRFLAGLGDQGMGLPTALI